MKRNNLQQVQNIQQQVHYQVDKEKKFECRICQKKIKEKEGFVGYFENDNIVIDSHVGCLIDKSLLKKKDKEEKRIITCP